MRLRILICLLIIAAGAAAQPGSHTWLRAFPITDYILDLNDSVKLVQVELPDDIRFREKQLGILKSIYREKQADTATKGYGRCQLIKGNYYYFAIGNRTSEEPLQAGDLLYTMMDSTDIYYGLMPKLAGHFIRLLQVTDEPFYDRYAVFRYWTKQEESLLLDSMVRDIQYTGGYFLEHNPTMNQPLTTGPYAGKNLLDLMKQCRSEWLTDFFSYVLARPRIYAGHEWKLSEIFATWLTAGAPVPLKD